MSYSKRCHAVYSGYYVQVFNAKKLSCRYVPHPYCVVSLNEVKVCRSQIKEAPDAFWDEEFILEYELFVNLSSVHLFSPSDIIGSVFHKSFESDLLATVCVHARKLLLCLFLETKFCC